MKRLMMALFVCGIACLSACSTSAESYVQDMPGYSIVKGRFTRIENMHSEEMTPLSDGIAFVLSRSDCRVSVEFDDYQHKVFNLDQGVILVHGADHDYILQSETTN